MTIVNSKPIWHYLQEHSEQIRPILMHDMFLADSNRPKKLSIQACGLLCDYSKNRVTDETMQLLFQLAETQQVMPAIKSLFAGDIINQSEQKPALHTLLRTPIDLVSSEHRPIAHEISKTLDKMHKISTDVRSGVLTGFSGKSITDIINIGIGGSDLGPMMLAESLSYYADKNIKLHFLSSPDKSHIKARLASLNPETTLIVIVSKSFSTEETLLNAMHVKSWLLDSANDDASIAPQIFAVTSNIAKAVEFGLLAENILPMWDSIGGRYSVWSAVSLSVVISLGIEAFKEFLHGAHLMDEHVQSSELQHNLPVIMALLGVWYHNFLESQTHLVVPYSSFLSSLPRYLQQLCMESQGKGVTQLGEKVDYMTGAIIWGESGTNSQHSFHQLLMQGTHTVPVDFILPIRGSDNTANHELASHCFAQSQVLMTGFTDCDKRDQIIPGNIPSNMILLDKLDPINLGSLIALYEHIVFVQSVIWDINPFDQWGVERGKVIASQLLPYLCDNATTEKLAVDVATQHLIDIYLSKNRG